LGQAEFDWESGAKPKSFEEALRRLEAIVSKLEEGGTTLEESVAAFKEGIELVKYCSAKLDSAEQSVRQLIESEGGGFKLEPFVPPRDDSGEGE